MPGFHGLETVRGTVLQTVGAINCVKGIVGGSAAGAIKDTLLFGVHIGLNAAAVTLTVAGLSDDTGAARNWVLSGQTTVDSWFWLPEPTLNEFAALTFTPSVAGKVTIFAKPYLGP